MPSTPAGLHYAPHGARIAAYLIDIFIMLPVALIVENIFGSAQLHTAFINIAIAATYYGGFVQSEWCATPGKRIMNLVVLTPDGRRLGWRDALARYFAVLLPGLPANLSIIPLELAFIIIIWLCIAWYGLILITEQRTAIHDLLCNTRVFEGRAI